MYETDDIEVKFSTKHLPFEYKNNLFYQDLPKLKMNILMIWQNLVMEVTSKQPKLSWILGT